jgi:hypothetical protein
MYDEINARLFLVLMAARKVGDYLNSWGGEEADDGGFDCSGFGFCRWDFRVYDWCRTVV